MERMVNRSQGHGSPPSQRKLEILIVDDDARAAERIGRMITAECGIPANVTQVLSADDAAARLDGDTVDLCLADYGMTDRDDFALLRGAQSRHSKTAFVFLAEQGRRDWVYTALSHGAQDCVRKDRLDPFEIAKTMAFALYHKSREAELTAAALRDSLTGLGNRALFNEQVKVLIEQARRNEDLLAVLFMDVDGLKPVNDRLGHSVGDRLLQQIAQRITGAMRKSDVVARLGGDEFAAVLPRVASRQTVSQVMDALTEAVGATPYAIDAHCVRIGLSCGAALFPDDSQSVDELLDLADSRMYASKKAKGRGPAPAAPPGAAMSWFPAQPKS
jgi:two-component system, cell cycle response regulator